MSSPDVAVWSDLRDEAVAAFKSFPPVKDELVLIDAFERSPVATRRAYEYTLGEKQADRIRAPWRIWALQCQRSRGDVSVSTAPDRVKALARARVWLANAGLHFDSADEVEEELFESPSATLAPWRSDAALRAEMVAEWQALRPRGEASDVERDERAKKWIADMKRLRQADADRRLEREQAADAEVREAVARRAQAEGLTVPGPS